MTKDQRNKKQLLTICNWLEGTMEEENCSTCKNCLDMIVFDYSHGGCEHTEVKDDYVCLAFEDDGEAIVMRGKQREKGRCECWEPKNGKTKQMATCNVLEQVARHGEVEREIMCQTVYNRVMET